MKKIKLIIVLLSIFMLLSTMLTIKSFAAENEKFSLTLRPSSVKVTKGQELKVTIKLSNIDVEGGISVLSGVLKYDDDALTLEKNNVKGLGDWVASYEESTGKILFDRANEVSNEQDIGTITFKVNASTSVANTAINLSTITAGNAGLDNTEKIRDISTNIQITTPITTTPEVPDSPTPSEEIPSVTPSLTPSLTPSITPSQIPTQTPTGGNVKNTTTEDPIPSTGADIYVIPLMILIAVLSIISFVNYKRLG